MNLKSFGCSFIFGSELNDDTGRLNPSQFTWPALLAQQIDRSYQCFATPGSGNLQILEQVLNQSAVSTSEDLFVIGWTWIDRFDYYDVNHDPKTNKNPWSTIRPIDTSNLAKVYYKELHSEYWDKLNCLCYVKLAIDTLTQKNIKFIMTYIDPLMFDTRWHITPAVEDLQQHVKPHMTTFDQLTFLEWSRSKGYSETDHWHPLEDAHKGAANFLINHSLV